MKSVPRLIAAIAILVCSCNISRSSHVVIGTKHPPIDPSQVKLYLHPPAKYEEIALISADSRNAFASAQSLMDSAIERLKSDAAKLGENGILLSSAGDQYGGTVGVTTANAAAYRAGDDGAVAFGTGFSSSTPVVNKAASGMAIYVIQE
jgi:hypothetical protein